MNKLSCAVLGVLAAFALTLGLGCFSKDTSFAAVHPQNYSLLGRCDCGSCHGKDVLKNTGKAYTVFNHDSDFLANHARAASQNTWVCTSCHAPSMCADCHAGKPGMNPGKKLAHRSDRIMPHRGDYLTKHKYDGRLDPASCFMCHGRGHSAKCIACHGQDVKRRK